jgi:ribosome biogenesis protein Nip4
LSHAYIWVHVYATERPDMNFIYGANAPPADSPILDPSGQ